MKIPYITINPPAIETNVWSAVNNLVHHEMMQMTELSYVKIEALAAQALLAAWQRGEISEMVEPFAIPFPMAGHVEIVAAPRSRDEAWRLWDTLRLRLSLEAKDSDAAIERLQRRFPQFYDRRPADPQHPRVLITETMFIMATGRFPENDDMERANCPLAGEIGHFGCGWNAEKNKPQWECK